MIKLKNGVEVQSLSYTSICKACGAEMHWAETKAGKKMPIVKDKDGDWISHFVDCPGASRFRKTK